VHQLPLVLVHFQLPMILKFEINKIPFFIDSIILPNANDNRIKRAASNKKEEELVFLF
jgi:hypothetical protein